MCKLKFTAHWLNWQYALLKLNKLPMLKNDSNSYNLQFEWPINWGLFANKMSELCWVTNTLENLMSSSQSMNKEKILIR